LQYHHNLNPERSIQSVQVHSNVYAGTNTENKEIGMKERFIAFALVATALLLMLGIAGKAYGEDKPLFEPLELQAATRYRLLKNSDDVITNNHIQGRFSVAGRFNLVSDGMHSVTFRLTTGNQFDNMWLNTPIGRSASDPQLDIAMRHLFYTIKPVDGLAVSIGSLDFQSGESLITTFTSEGYFTGLRADLNRPDLVYFDQVSLSAGSLKDLNRADTFSRLHRLGSFNFAELLVAKKFDRVTLSTALTYLDDTWLVKPAATINVPELVVIDKLHAEGYVRIRPETDFGYALWADKQLGRFLLFGGYANIDRFFALNDGRWGTGDRVFAGAKYNLVADGSLQLRGFYTHAFDNSFKIGNEDRFELQVVVDLMPMVRKNFQQ
jgi:hypothetical protein